MQHSTRNNQNKNKKPQQTESNNKTNKNSFVCYDRMCETGAL